MGKKKKSRPNEKENKKLMSVPVANSLQLPVRNTTAVSIGETTTTVEETNQIKKITNVLIHADVSRNERRKNKSGPNLLTTETERKCSYAHE